MFFVLYILLGLNGIRLPHVHGSAVGPERTSMGSAIGSHPQPIGVRPAAPVHPGRGAQ